MKHLFAALAVALVCRVSGAPLFSGYVATSREVYFALSDSDGGGTSRWLKVGQSWQGYRLAYFDQHLEVLTLVKGDESKTLNLQGITSKAPVALPNVANGQFFLEDGSIVYSIEMTIKLGGLEISSSDGVMVSDQSKQIVSGDLTIRAGSQNLIVTGGTVRLVDGKPVVTGETLKFLPPNAPSPNSLTSR